MNNSKSCTNKYLLVILGLFLLIINLKLSFIYLENNFDYLGESYYKGYGHLFSENSRKTLIFLFLRFFITCSILGAILFIVENNMFRTIKIICLIILTISLTYFTLNLYKVIYLNSHVLDRTIEICLIWVLSAIGLYFGYIITKKKIIFNIVSLLVTLTTLTFCNFNQPKHWRKMDCGLYMSPTGDIGFASIPERANVDVSELKSEECPNSFLTTFNYDDTTQLKYVIDTLTFKQIDAWEYKDASHYYEYSPMCDGGYFYLLTYK